MSDETMPVETKPFWMSKGLWGSAIAIAAVALGFFGYQFGMEDQAAAVEVVMSVIAGGGALWAMYGGTTADKALTNSW